jgi:hypothetical protein
MGRTAVVAVARRHVELDAQAALAHEERRAWIDLGGREGEHWQRGHGAAGAVGVDDR